MIENRYILELTPAAGLWPGEVYMKYRINRKTGDRISEIGIGSSYMYEAGKCVYCGHCDSRCPFAVSQSRLMQEIREYMVKI